MSNYTTRIVVKWLTIDPRNVSLPFVKFSLWQLVLYYLKQFAQIEGFPDKIVSERFAQGILPSYMSGEEDDGNVFCQFMGLQLLADGSTVFSMQKDIEQDEIYVVALDMLEN
ncbi:MAG TPA: hypothetical protein VFQ36_17395 [Ktedonobacteraceae bacterium]|nr:hypothetical protein [Ktedonobacteraceae bacterium]